MSRIALIPASNYRPENIHPAVRQIFDLLDIQDMLRPNMKVTLKPNLLMKRRPQETTTTHPSVMKAVICELRLRGITDITIADSPGGPYTRSSLHGIYETSGMMDAAKVGAELNYNTGWQTLYNPNNHKVSRFNIIHPVADADLVISIGKLKTHCMTTLSGGVKNLFGCIPGLQKPELHYRFTDRLDFCDMLVDLAQTVRPALTIMDAVVSMEGDGPSGGTPRKTGFLAASADPFSLDVALGYIIGVSPQDIPTIRRSIERGLVSGNVEDLDIVGQPSLLAPIRGYQLPRSKDIDFLGFLPGTLRPAAELLKNKLLIPRPVINPSKCIGCGKCAESCPAHTITLHNHKATVQYDRCIRCYCCHEMCPVKAIAIKRFKLFDL